VVVASPENCAVLYRAIIELARDVNKGNERGAIGRAYADKQRKKEKVRTEIIDKLKTLPKKGNEVSINPFPKA